MVTLIYMRVTSRMERWCDKSLFTLYEFYIDGLIYIKRMRYSHCIDLLRFLLMLTLMITSIKATVDISFFHNNINRSSGTIYFIPCIQLLSITKGSCLLSLIRYEFYYDSYCHHNYSNCL